MRTEHSASCGMIPHRCIALLVAGLIVVLPAAPATAGLPHDPLKTLERVQGGRIRVGVVENAPWAEKHGQQATGTEIELLRTLARELGAVPEWHWGGEQAHMEALAHYQLDLVIGGITAKTPWKKQVGLTDNYFNDHVMATAPGENAWIMRLDQFLSSHRNDVPKMLVAASFAGLRSWPYRDRHVMVAASLIISGRGAARHGAAPGEAIFSQGVYMS